MYAVTRTLTDNAVAAPAELTMCGSYTEARDLASELAEEDGESYTIFQAVEEIQPRTEPEPLEKVYGVTPGVDFPATLFRPGGASC